MNPRMWALGATILLASALGAVGVITVRSTSDEQAAVAPDKMNLGKADKAGMGPARDETCRRLARKVTGRDLTDTQLDRVVRRHEACQAVVVDSVDGSDPSSGGSSGEAVAVAGIKAAVIGSEDDDGSDEDFDESDGDPTDHDDSGGEDRESEDDSGEGDG